MGLNLGICGGERFKYEPDNKTAYRGNVPPLLESFLDNYVKRASAIPGICEDCELLAERVRARMSPASEAEGCTPSHQGDNVWKADYRIIRK